jgi:hypothetical protein
LRAKYGISPEDLDAQADRQGSRCAICGLRPERLDYDDCTEESSDDVLCVDHEDRADGPYTRGLLCKNCNLGLGHFQDSEVLLDQAIKYLDRSRRNRNDVVAPTEQLRDLRRRTHST